MCVLLGCCLHCLLSLLRRQSNGCGAERDGSKSGSPDSAVHDVGETPFEPVDLRARKFGKQKAIEALKFTLHEPGLSTLSLSSALAAGRKSPDVFSRQSEGNMDIIGASVAPAHAT